MKNFTVAEAEALIPQLEKIFEAVADLAAKAKLKAEQLSRAEDAGADPAEIAIERGQLQFLAQTVDEQMRRIVELGAQPKGIEPALVDFPSRLGGREILLCWRLGEKAITHYHGMDEGFSNRKPLPRRRPS